MDRFFYWLDHGSWAAGLAHSWMWATVTSVLAVGTLAGLVALARHYDAPLARDR